MEILHEINPALEALAYLGSRANGHTLDRLEERLQARGVRKAEPFHRASAALRELLQNQGRVMTYQMLVSRIWNYDYLGDDRVIYSHIKNLRRKLGADYIRTVRGVGYRVDKD